jgi:hypothetical protein
MSASLNFSTTSEQCMLATTQHPSLNTCLQCKADCWHVLRRCSSWLNQIVYIKLCTYFSVSTNSKSWRSPGGLYDSKHAILPYSGTSCTPTKPSSSTCITCKHISNSGSIYVSDSFQSWLLHCIIWGEPARVIMQALHCSPCWWQVCCL